MSALTEHSEAAIDEFGFGPLHSGERHSAYPGRVGDRLADILGGLEDAVAALDWEDIIIQMARLRRLNMALDACSLLDGGGHEQGG